MSLLAIGLGLFLLFALAFVGGIGDGFHTGAACTSGATLILSGAFGFSRGAEIASRVFALLAGLAYLPVIYQRLTWDTGTDWQGLPFDAAYLWVAARLIFRSSQNTNLQADEERTNRSSSDA